MEVATSSLDRGAFGSPAEASAPFTSAFRGERCKSALDVDSCWEVGSEPGTWASHQVVAADQFDFYYLDPLCFPS